MKLKSVLFSSVTVAKPGVGWRRPLSGLILTEIGAEPQKVTPIPPLLTGSI